MGPTFDDSAFFEMLGRADQAGAWLAATRSATRLSPSTFSRSPGPPPDVETLVTSPGVARGPSRDVHAREPQPGPGTGGTRSPIRLSATLQSTPPSLRTQLEPWNSSCVSPLPGESLPIPRYGKQRWSDTVEDRSPSVRGAHPRSTREQPQEIDAEPPNSSRDVRAARSFVDKGRVVASGNSAKEAVEAPLEKQVPPTHSSSGSVPIQIVLISSDALVGIRSPSRA